MYTPFSMAGPIPTRLDQAILEGGLMKGRDKRRQYSIVDRSLQYRFLALVLVYGAVIVFFLGVSLFVPDILDIMNEDLALETRAMAADRMLSLHSRVWPAIVALLCFLGLHSFRIFHRLIGPLYRFRMVFGEVMRGSLDIRVKLRKKDYLHSEEEGFNDMMDVIQRKWDEVQSAIRQGQASLGELEKSIPEVSGWRNEDLVILKKLREELNSLADIVGYFGPKEEEKQG